jgi:hypothetical protein
VTLAGAPDQITLALTRHRGKRTVTVARTRARSLSRGVSLLVLYARGLKPGTYQLLARGAHSGQLAARVTITRPRSHRHRRGR